MKRVVIWAGAVVLLLILVGPFLMPIPPLEGTVPSAELADSDSQFVEIDGLNVHYKMAGQGEPTLILLHGFGASVFSWREVFEPLRDVGTVIAFDRPAFGLTERPMPGEWSDSNPYSPEAQADLTVALMDEFDIQQAVLVGNSAGGTVATLTALEYPERVQALVLVDAAIYSGGGTPGLVRPLLQLPQMRRLGPYLVRSIATRGEGLIRTAWHDPSKITPDVIEEYREPLKTQNWDRALWELTLTSHPLGLPERLGRIQQPTLVITGDDDRIVPTEESVRLANEMPGAELVVIPECGHVPQEECPEPFIEAVSNFLEKLEK